MNKYIKALLLLLFFIFSPLQAGKKIMPLGDSITWDWHYNDGRTDAYRHGYRNYLWYKLQDTGYEVDFVGSKNNGGAINPKFDGNNEGYTGYTTYKIADLVYNRLQRYTPDIILLHIGTNDSLNHSSSDLSGLESILDEIDRYEKTYHREVKVILARIVPLPKMGSWVSTYNQNLDSLTAERIKNGDDIVVVNMNVVTSLIDGIHPTSSGYQQMANIWFGALKELLKDDYGWLVPINNLILNP
jgi:lysophospholipase L1-like esterase